MKSRVESLPTGTPGLRVKMARMRELVETAKRDPVFVRRARSIVAQARERDADAEIGAVSAFVRRGIRYVADPLHVELFTDPRVMLADALAGTGAGDCDELSTLGAALLESVGYPTRWRVGGEGENWQHVWLDVKHPRRGWLPVDDTAKGRPVGFDPSRGRFSTVGTFHAHDREGIIEGMHGFGRRDDLLGLGGGVCGGYLCELPDGTLGKGGFKKKFKKLSKKLLKVAAPIAAFVPGIGPVAAMAIGAAQKAVAARDAKKRANRAAAQEQAAAAAAESAMMSNASYGQTGPMVDLPAPAMPAPAQTFAPAPAPAPSFAPQPYSEPQPYVPLPESYPSDPIASQAEFVPPALWDAPNLPGDTPQLDYVLPDDAPPDLLGLGVDWGGLFKAGAEAGVQYGVRRLEKSKRGQRYAPMVAHALAPPPPAPSGPMMTAATSSGLPTGWRRNMFGVPVPPALAPTPPPPATSSALPPGWARNMFGVPMPKPAAGGGPRAMSDDYPRARLIEEGRILKAGGLPPGWSRNQYGAPAPPREHPGMAAVIAASEAAKGGGAGGMLAMAGLAAVAMMLLGKGK